MPFLPVSRQDMEERGIEQLDFICFTGDAYIDHPTFGIAIISRMIEAAGFTVGIIAQPLCDADYMKLGKPKYCFMVTGGNIDSMVSNYTVALKKRNDDAYSPGGKGGRRPDRALTVYCQNLKRLYPDVEISIGGLEASLRRFAHYDYWTDSVMPSVLVSSGADYLMYGMGEVTLTQMLNNFKAGLHLRDMHDLRGICYLTEPENTPIGAVQCDSFEIVRDNKKAYAKSCRKQYDEQDEVYGRTIVQRHGDKMLVQNPPQRSVTQAEFDYTYELPYMRMYHPMYEKEGGVPAIQEVEFSITHNRGCFGFCNFCSIALHQGRPGADPQRGQRIRGSGQAVGESALQGVYPRRRRTHRELPSPVLREAGEIRHVQGEEVSCAHSLQESHRRPQRLYSFAAPPALHQKGEEDIHSFRNQVRLHAPG